MTNPNPQHRIKRFHYKTFSKVALAVVVFYKVGSRYAGPLLFAPRFYGFVGGERHQSKLSKCPTQRHGPSASSPINLCPCMACHQTCSPPCTDSEANLPIPHFSTWLAASSSFVGRAMGIPMCRESRYAANGVRNWPERPFVGYTSASYETAGFILLFQTITPP